ncbi:sugar phosphate isomerase/epimerase family protein [Rhizobium sp. SYY.PMSO]|uniref:sugar phosphate isomerase/epimerase family protein n=1 Tax=Rhizobium sp. SYY.PMSO TaxID=3382192 RepID=UPI00398FFDC7
MFRYSWSQALFIDETLEESLERLSRYGYDGVELPLMSMLPSEIKSRLNAHGLKCTSVNGRFVGRDRDLSSSDDDIRSAAVSYVRSCLQFASHIGAPVAIIVPTRIGKLSPETSLAQEWDNVVRSLEEIGRIGQGLGVTAVIECVNRAETYLANRLETAHRLVKDSGSPHVGLMADSFHMNIEENDVHGALRSVAGHLKHVHLADNNRTAPGMGHLDLGRFLETLFGIGYRGAIAMECDVQALDRYGRNAFTSDPEVFDRYAETAISNLKRMEAGLQTKVAV